MPPIPPDTRLEQSLLKSVKDGLYPDSEEVLSAKLPSSALDSLEQLLRGAREEVETSIRELSRLSAPDLDGWISQAKQLRDGVHASQGQAEEIGRLGKGVQSLREHEQDASAKVSFLEEEMAFYNDLAATMEYTKTLTSSLAATQAALSGDQVLDATRALQKVEAGLQAFKGRHQTTVGGLLTDKSAELRSAIAASLMERWNSIVQVDKRSTKVVIKNRNEGPGSDFHATIKGMSTMGFLDDCTASLARDIMEVLLAPCIQQATLRPSISLLINGDRIQLHQDPGSNIPQLLAGLDNAVLWLSQRLPPPVFRPLGQRLAPAIASRLVSDYLPSIVPANLTGMAAFRSELENVNAFASHLEATSDFTPQEVIDWVANAPHVWLAKRSGSSLNSIRQILKRGLGSPRAVERVETQTVSDKDEVFAPKGNDDDDDWDAGWNEETNAEPRNALQTTPAAAGNGDGGDIGDEDAWGVGDDESGTKEAEEQPTLGGGEDDGEAWGWGDEAPVADATKPISPKLSKAAQKTQTNGQSKGERSIAHNERTMTLKEIYNVTAIPEQILEITYTAINDAEKLSADSRNPISSAAQGLLQLPESLMAMFRAIAPNYYGHNLNGNVFIYNDSLYIAEQLRSFSDLRRNRSGKVDLTSVVSAAAELELYGKRAYGKEMESQRMVLRDLLDDAQGFANCAEQPSAQQCDVAIASTVDHLKEVHRQWASVLSHSALRQSIGSLLSTVVSKIAVDIGDLGDIGEEESQRLVALCNRVTELDSLFVPERPPDANPNDALVPLTTMYTPGWLKFQYLLNILESSLVDIKYLWTEGELSFEFTVDEVVDLIEALFADSEHRRRVVAEIKRGARRV